MNYYYCFIELKMRDGMHFVNEQIYQGYFTGNIFLIKYVNYGVVSYIRIDREVFLEHFTRIEFIHQTTRTDVISNKVENIEGWDKF